MDDINAFERQVAAETVRAMGPIRPVDDLALFSAATTAAPRWELRSVFGATRSVVAGAIVVLIGVFVVAGLLTIQPSDERLVPAADAPEGGIPRTIELPAVLPDGVESGALDTPLGPARWAHIEGDELTVPPFIDPVPVPGGFITLRGGYDEDLQSGPLLWRSSDLVTWSPVELGLPAGEGQLLVASGVYWLAVDGDGESPAVVLRSTDATEWEPVTQVATAATAELSQTDDAVWIRTSEPMGLWRSTDTTSWQEIDLRGIGAPDPTLFDWGASVEAPISSGDIDIVAVDYVPVRTDHLFGLDVGGGGIDLLEVVPGVWEARDIDLEPPGQDKGTLRFEEIEDGIRVIDAANGTALSGIDGVGIEFIQEWALNGWQKRRFGIIDGVNVIPTDVPTSDRKPTTVFGTDDGLFAYLPLGYDRGATGVWRSSDGSTWTEIEPVPDKVGSNGIKDMWVDTSHPQPVIFAWLDVHAWRSTDGLTWEMIPQPGHALPPTYPDWRGTWYQGSAEADSVDEAQLQQALATIRDLAERTTDRRARSTILPVFTAASPNTYTYAITSGTDDSPVFDLWVVTFDDLPT